MTKFNHIISASQFDNKFIKELFSITDRIKNGQFNPNSLKGKIMATIFYEPSTRTRLSFESAMLRLGGQIISTENAGEFSSAAKGETLEDTVRILNSYCDVIVLRHFNKGASQTASEYSKVPVVNAGDGNGEHPTQALLDLYTIFSKFKKTDITITMVGDLLNGRTIHSLSYLLSLYSGVSLNFVSPKQLSIPQNLKNHLKKAHIRFSESEDLQTALSTSDVIYMTRIQKERFKSATQYKKYFGKYILNRSSLEKMKEKAIIMHPLPRVNEIAPEIDTDPRSIYFEQAENGVHIRCALLIYLFDKTGSKN